MNFNTFKSRFDDSVIQDLLGESALTLVQLIDPQLASRSNLSQLLLDYHTPAGLLLNKNTRSLLFELLDPREAEQLATLLKLDPDTDNIYVTLQQAGIYRGSQREQRLFAYFGVPVPPVREVDPTPPVELTEAAYPLFSHQRTAVRSIQAYLTGEFRRALLHMPTGSGKTRTSMNIIAEHLRANEPTLVIWLAHSQELCEQAALEFQKAWHYLGNRHLNVYRYWGSHEIDVQDMADGFLVAGLQKTYQSATSNIEFITNLGRQASLVIMDEAHSAVAETYQLVLNTLVIPHRETALLGLTATPGRTWLDMDADEELAKFFYHQKVSLQIEGYGNPVNYLVDEGYLAEAHFDSLFYKPGNELTEADLRRIQSNLDIPSNILQKLAEDEQRNLQIIGKLEELAERHSRIIVFAATVEHSRLLAAILTMRGYNARSVTGDMSSVDRERAITHYKEKTEYTRFLCNYGVLTTGFDAPQTSAALIARPTKSLVLYSQMVGRAIRGTLAGGNDHAEIVTVVDQQLPGFRSVAEAFNHWEDIWE